MDERPPHIRSHLRKFDDEPCWSAIDVITGQPHVLNGVILDSFEADEADDMVGGILKFP